MYIIGGIDDQISPFFIIVGLGVAAERFADFSFFFLLAGALQVLFSME